MQNKILGLFAALAILAGCMDNGEPYAPGSLNILTVKAVYPDGISAKGGATVSIVEVSGITSYTVSTGADGSVVTEVPNGIYRITVRDRNEDFVFNAAKDKVLISNENVSLDMELKASKAGAIVVKEIYCGGCSKAPKEGTYQSDKYIILHNNSLDTEYLDGLSMGTLSPGRMRIRLPTGTSSGSTSSGPFSVSIRAKSGRISMRALMFFRLLPTA